MHPDITNTLSAGSGKSGKAELIALCRMQVRDKLILRLAWDAAGGGGKWPTQNLVFLNKFIG